MPDQDVAITGLKEHEANEYTSTYFDLTLGDYLKREINAGQSQIGIARALRPHITGGKLDRHTIEAWLRKRKIEVVTRARSAV